MAATKNIKLWNDRFDLLNEYVKEYNKLPTSLTEYKGIKIGGWLQNQRTAYKKGNLPEECSRLLNDTYPFWCSSLKEIEDGNKNLLINSDWKSKLPEGGIPIDTIFSGDKLYDYLSKNIFDIETLLKSNNSLNIHCYYNCLSKIIPIINPRYALLLRCIFGEPTVAPLDDMKQFFYSFCVSSSEEMQDKMNKMISSGFTDREKEVLKIRFALTEDIERNMTLDEVGKVLGISRHRVRQIEAKALRKMRHPNKLNIIRKAGNFLDDDLLDQKTRATLYRLGIDSKDKIIKIIEDDENSSFELKDKLKEFIKKYEERETKEMRQIEIREILIKPLDHLEISVRSYNALKRAGVNNIEDVVKLYNDLERLHKVRNFGKMSIEEVRNKLNSLGVLGLEIKDEVLEEKKPTNTQSFNKGFSTDSFNMEEVEKEIDIKRRIDQIISELYSLIQGNEISIPNLEDLCTFVFFNSKDPNKDIGLSNLLTVAMLYVRDPKVILNNEFKKWVKYSIVIYKYLNEYGYDMVNQIIDGEMFNLRDALIACVFYEYSKNNFINPKTFKEISNNIIARKYDNIYLFDRSSKYAKFYLKDFTPKALHTTYIFQLYAYDALKITKVEDLTRQFSNIHIPNIKQIIESTSPIVIEYLQFMDKFIKYYSRFMQSDLINDLENTLYKIILTEGAISIESFKTQLEKGKIQIPNLYKEMIIGYIRANNSINKNKFKFKTGDKVQSGDLKLIVAYEKTPGIITCINPFKFDVFDINFKTIDIPKDRLIKGWEAKNGNDKIY